MWSVILTVVIILLIIAVIAFVLLYRLSSRMRVQNYEAERLMDSFSQVVPILIIDKKKMRLKDAPLPREAYERTPKYLRWMKVYIVRGKVGPRVVNLICEKDIYDELPLKTTIQGKISGLYLKEIKKGAVPTEKTLKKRRKEKEKAAKKAKTT